MNKLLFHVNITSCNVMILFRLYRFNCYRVHIQATNVYTCGFVCVYDTHEWVCMYSSMYSIDTDFILHSEIYFLKYLLSHTISRIFF